MNSITQTQAKEEARLKVEYALFCEYVVNNHRPWMPEPHLPSYSAWRKMQKVLS
jgi:hypothetical protein